MAVQSLHRLKVSEWIKYKIIYLTKFWIPLSHHISTTLYLFSLLMVITHTLHLMSLRWNHLHHSKSLFAPSNIAQNSSSELFIPLSVNFIWTCQFNLLHTAITFRHFSLFHSELKTYLFSKSYPPPVPQVCFSLLDWFHGSVTGLIYSSVFIISFYLFRILVICHVLQTKWPASGQLSAHGNILIFLFLYKGVVNSL